MNSEQATVCQDVCRDFLLVRLKNDRLILWNHASVDVAGHPIWVLHSVVCPAEQIAGSCFIKNAAVRVLAERNSEGSAILLNLGLSICSAVALVKRGEIFWKQQTT